MNKTTANYKLVLLFSLLSVSWIIALFMESSQPPAKFIEAAEGLDKVAHFVAFAVLALLVCAAWLSGNARSTIPLFSMPLLIVILVGAGEELYQMSVPDRAGSLEDLLADVCGAIFAIVLTNRSGMPITLRQWL